MVDFTKHFASLGLTGKNPLFLSRLTLFEFALGKMFIRTLPLTADETVCRLCIDPPCLNLRNGF